ncbi:Rpr2-domain-containing protein [Trametes cingulata]|nr:Rpr2-domain-containing protein [Trametes cingulata]
MGKKNKDQEPVANLSSVANRDIVQRINFLYQASTYLSAISQALPSSAADGGFEVSAQGTNQKSKRKSTLRHPKNTAELSRSYIGTMRIVGQKTMVRMDPSLKRTLCKGCDAVLLPGTSATVRVKPLPSHGQAVVYTCLTCRTSRRIPAPSVLDPTTSAQDDGGVGLTERPAASSTSASVPEVLAADASAMVVDPVHATAQPSYTSSRARRPRKKRIARVPPLFERKGHVTFRGNERLPEEDAAA